jgi:hypothetical protein
MIFSPDKLSCPKRNKSTKRTTLQDYKGSVLGLDRRFHFKSEK